MLNLLLMLLSISTHTPHARRDTLQILHSGVHFGISTHTPHARRDSGRNVVEPILRISTHTPHARRDVDTMLPSRRC